MERVENIARIEIPAKEGHGATIGWQFRMKRNRKKVTKFFSDSSYGGKEQSLNAAIEYKEEMFQKTGQYVGGYLSDVLPAHNTSGIIGVHRSESIRQRDAKIEEVWQCSTPTQQGKSSTRSFYISRHGELGALYKAIEQRLNDVSALIGTEKYRHCEQTIKNLVERYLNILVYLESVTEDESKFIIQSINSNKISGTEKEEIITGRVGHASFRDKLLKLWGGKCCITGSNLMLHASHIKPWSSSSDSERLDPFNGFLLSPLYDKAFDQGLISFQDSGNIIVSEKIRSDTISILFPENLKITGISQFSIRYLQYHREKIYKGAGEC